MRKLFTLLAVTVLCSGIALAIEVKTITGEGKCAKCELKEAKTCQNVIEVEEGGKTVKYYLTHDKVSKDYHKSSGICSSVVKTKATGEVEEKDGKKTITATKIEKAE